MEDLSEGHSEDDKGHPEKNKKRIIKTRAQIEALESLYEEHKYPTDEMKADLADSSGLTEKQISGWFCHRRLKDKRLSSGEMYGNGRQDRSSGVFQDHGSGVRQDSCGSTKQADDRKFDHREVESRRLTGPEVSTAEEVGTHFRAKSNPMDNASSRSSSSLRNECFSPNAESYDLATSRISRYMSQNVATDLKPRKGPSGYLKVKGQVENVAITAVKRQLGRHYRFDGPPLGVEFDTLPLGAFESSPNLVSDPYYPGEPVPPCSPHVPNIYRCSYSGAGYRPNSKTNSHDSALDGLGFKGRTISAHPEHNEWTSSTDMSVRKMAVDNQDTSKFVPKHGRAEIRTSTGPSNGVPSPYVGKVKTKPRVSHLNIAEKKHFDGKPFDSEGSSYLDFGERELTKIVEKDHVSVIRTASFDEDCNPIRVKVPQHNETRDVKRALNEVTDHQEYPRRASVIGMPQHTNHQISRTAAEMPPSFSKDEETEESSSSEG